MAYDSYKRTNTLKRTAFGRRSSTDARALASVAADSRALGMFLDRMQSRPRPVLDLMENEALFRMPFPGSTVLRVMGQRHFRAAHKAASNLPSSTPMVGSSRKVRAGRARAVETMALIILTVANDPAVLDRSRRPSPPAELSPRDKQVWVTMVEWARDKVTMLSYR